MTKSKDKVEFNDILKVSSIASKKLKDILESSSLASPWLRIAAKKDDCGCIDYQMKLDKEPNESDQIIMNQDLKIFIDEESAELLRGSEMSFATTPEGEGFTFENPNSEHRADENQK
jgi:iron-sulfur cluster assembly protein